jgi:hypothetical protein
MEYVSVLAGEAWSDRPVCTHPRLAAVARFVNDTLEDEHRSLLVPIIGRLFGTNVKTSMPLIIPDVGRMLDDYYGKQTSIVKTEWDAYLTHESQIEYMSHRYSTSLTFVLSDSWVPTGMTTPESGVWAEVLIAEFHALLDEFYRITGLDTPEPLSEEKLADLHRAVTTA